MTQADFKKKELAKQEAGGEGQAAEDIREGWRKGGREGWRETVFLLICLFGHFGFLICLPIPLKGPPAGEWDGAG